MAERKPASGRSGFFQGVPRVPNQFLHDEVQARVIKLFLPQDIQDAIAPDLERFGNAVLSKKVLDWNSDAERNTPYLRGSGYDSFGVQADSLVTSEGWRCLQDMGFREGIVAAAYDLPYGSYNRLAQFIKYQLWNSSSAGVTCPSAMQDGAASVLRGQLANGNYDDETREVLQDALGRLISRDPAVGWTSGQWMTERKGGSDVSGTETIATYAGSAEGTSADGLPLGPWRIDGFKWFSSATDCSMTIMLAQTSKGLSCFFAPTRRTVNGRDEMNGIRIQRLKSKMGTRPLPTAELELEGMRAYLLGEEGKGVKVISGLLNITRVYNSVSAVGSLGRGLAIARAYGTARRAGNRLLSEFPLFRKTLAKQFMAYRANALLAFFVVHLLGLTENPNGPPSLLSKSLSTKQRRDLLRLLTPVAKGTTAKASIAGLQEAMEALGGVGYLENEESQSINVARIFRDANVLSIWEGTTDVMATDTVKVLKSRDSANVLSAAAYWTDTTMSAIDQKATAVDAVAERLREAWKNLEQHVAATPLEELTADGREVMTALADIVCGLLLAVDAASDRDTAAVEVCLRFAEDRLGLERKEDSGWEKRSHLDGLIAFPDPLAEGKREGSKL